MLWQMNHLHCWLIYGLAMLTTRALWCQEHEHKSTTNAQNWLTNQPAAHDTVTLLSMYGNNSSSDAYNSSSRAQELQPFFENFTQRAVVAALGRTAKLHCRVRNLSDRAVSWIRKRDLHILTIGVMTYTNDQRFQAQHHDESDEWVLKIISVQPRDSGIYECQVSTEPKISQAFRLTVVVAKAKILASPEIFFKVGSDINLTCVAQQAPMPPSYIYWYKDGDLINYSQRGGISVLTERLTKTSKLLIARVGPSDSGNYTCTPSNSNSDSVAVHVIKSEHPAAMQHERAAAALQVSKLLLLWTLLLSAVAATDCSYVFDKCKSLLTVGES